MTDLAFFQNRLTKNWRHRARWAAREGVDAFRVYERDIPEFPVIADWYLTDEGPRLVLSEVDTAWRQTPAEHSEWIGMVAETCAEVLAIETRAVVVKTRVRQRVASDATRQYQRLGASGREAVVKEGGHQFLVNLHDYLDTGLFLDHRVMRAMVGTRAAGRRFLNLFAYTGSFTVYAAGGGATASESVDMSNTYCAWAERNLARNGHAADVHRVVRADVLVWLSQAIRERKRFDLIVLDPPSFSNSKKMAGVLDTQRDHARLIDQCLTLLSPQGELFFSTNLRSFTLDPSLASDHRARDISARTLPADFRDPRIHQAWHFQA